MAVRASLPAFLAVGATAAAVHLGAMWLAVAICGLPPAWANPLAFLPAFAASFTGHCRYTYGSTRRWRASLPRWLATSLAGLMLNQLLYVAALAHVGVQYYLPLQALVTVLVAAMTFMAGKCWAFAR
ncbi:hypothetical protein GCM10027277_03970 [Pseudoduganella ginsengisoli]|uniref:GtrA family protein n=1 Tax=Pseudoduganella ginsengisoli TaxID=1462440 RepID=A0A6L6Q6U3_9BURK|nr:GtrA family protein [Pseudoduganella ginsengisoli]MTW04832.1 GtrA family protein [Pseudoduganella ginsengisoli]